ncbi:HvfC/BufC N-terminal domain-containing protein [Serratia rhizosphaerae]
MQRALYQALLDGNGAVPQGLTTWNGSDPARRFAVYRNNVMASLISALAENCPVLVQLVGDGFFRAMAAEFIRRHPPTSPVLADYGTALPAWLAGFPPLADWPWLADLAQLELLCIESLHAADAMPDNAGQPTLSADSVLRLHPSLRLFGSPFAVFSLWAAHQQDQAPAELDPCRAEQVLLFRHQDDVRLIAIGAAELRFLHALRTRKSLAQALTAALAEDTAFAVQPVLQRLHHYGLILCVSGRQEK